MKTDEDIIGMLPGDLKGIARAAGVEAAIRIARTFKGSFIYVPSVDELMRVARDAVIRKEYHRGTGARKLARKHGISERQIWKILRNPGSETLPEELLEFLKETG